MSYISLTPSANTLFALSERSIMLSQNKQEFKRKSLFHCSCSLLLTHLLLGLWALTHQSPVPRGPKRALEAEGGISFKIPLLAPQKRNKSYWWWLDPFSQSLCLLLINTLYSFIYFGLILKKKIEEFPEVNPTSNHEVGSIPGLPQLG